MEDLRLYNSIQQYTDNTKTSELTELAYPEEGKAKSIEVIANKVIKFFLTSKGSDVFNPDYGSVSMHHTQISEAYIPELTFEVRADIDNCLAFIKDAEQDYSVDGEKLADIILNDIRYNARTTPWRIDIYLEIVTTYGKHAVVVITNNTDN